MHTAGDVCYEDISVKVNTSGTAGKLSQNGHTHILLVYRDYICIILQKVNRVT